MESQAVHGSVTLEQGSDGRRVNAAQRIIGDEKKNHIRVTDIGVG